MRIDKFDDIVNELQCVNASAIADPTNTNAENICLASRSALIQAFGEASLRGPIDTTAIQPLYAAMTRGVELLRNLKWDPQVMAAAQLYARHCEERIEHLKTLVINGSDAAIDAMANDIRDC